MLLLVVFPMCGCSHCIFWHWIIWMGIVRIKPLFQRDHPHRLGHLLHQNFDKDT